ncbi:HAD hydrolase-like protein [Microbacterium sediminis]|uniref:Phosphatase n=1 Tax=Microbacterium sediminis TaxID=904291 RepID=A0A1B9NIN7_9MICO|nr:HAD hydrolase-like protein [Microbacterium sediminis]OCG76445.1 phosphatase [Microbacterium sediminis]QBR73022.1 phosphatase [Microbacterium sediminis]
MPTSPWSCVLWDVDGTVADASPGILPRITAVLTALGRTPPAPEDLRHWIGPPLLESFEVRGGLTPDEAVEAVRTYRELASREGYAAAVDLYPGVPEIIRALHAADVPQGTASTKPENQVFAILTHYGLADCFATITGARADATVLDTKADVLGRALERLRDAGVDTSRPVLIGDRHHDVDGAAEYGIPVIFVRWGFGNPGEDAGAHAVVDTADQLRPLLLTD